MQPYAIQSATGSDSADEWVRLGVQFHEQGKLPEAMEKYGQALRIDPRHTTATLNLAVAQAQTPGQINDALLTIERAATLDDTTITIPTAHCLMALDAGRIDEAISVGRLAVSRAPKNANGNHARYALALCYPAAGHPEFAVPLYEEILKYEPQHGGAGPNLCFVQTLLPLNTEQTLNGKKRWYEANRYTGAKKPHANDRALERPIRVGYVSGDFKSHSAAFIFTGVVLHHSSDIVPYFYSTLPVDAENDIRTKRIQEVAGDRWRDCFPLDDDKMEALIREDQIDILVDLAGHTGGNRLAVFTRKPAPIQVTAWGFAHGTSIPEIDYFFADPIAVPDRERFDRFIALKQTRCYEEEIIDLPCIVTMDDPAWYNTKASSPAPLKRNGYVTFGAYARYEKMSDDCLHCYKRVLQVVPDSKIEFKDHAYVRPYSIRRITEIMAPEVSADRLLFSISTNHLDHLRAYQQADICLDPFPHGGGVVVLEQLYMGVPVVTLYGTQPAGRTAASLLTLMNRKDWIAYSCDEYVEKAIALAENTKEMADARKVLRKQLLESPAVKDYVGAVESAYRRMWQRWCRGDNRYTTNGGVAKSISARLPITG